MRFQPKSDEQITKDNAFAPFPKGEYDFEITSAIDKVSRAGNEMIELRIEIFNSEGKKRGLFDWLMEKVMYKLSHCAKACGLETEYDSGSLEAWMFEGKTGRCMVEIKPAEGDYPEGNKIKDYIVPDVKLSEATQAGYKRATRPNGGSAGADLDDAIPFGPCWQ